MSTNIIFIAPAANRQVNPKHFLGYFPGGEGGGVNYDAFADFGRHPHQNAECLPLIPAKSCWNADWKLATKFELEMRSQS